MKFYLRLVIIAALVVGGVYLIQQRQEEVGRIQKHNAEVLREEAAQSSSSQTPAAASAPASLQTPGTPVPVQRAAQKAGAEVLSTTTDQGWTVVTVRADDRNKLSDFLDQARAEGMRDMDASPAPFSQVGGPGGRTLYQTTYRIKF